MLKIILFVFYFFNLATLLFSSESNLNFLKKQQQLDYFVIRFEVDEKDETLFNNLFKIIDDWRGAGWGQPIYENCILFFSLFKIQENTKELKKSFLDSKNFGINKDFFIQINSEFNNFEIEIIKMFEGELLFRKENQNIRPGKKYILKFQNLHLFKTIDKFDYKNWRNCLNKIPNIEIEIQDIQENQLKVKNVLNEVLDTVPTDVNKLISEYLV